MRSSRPRPRENDGLRTDFHGFTGTAHDAVSTTSRAAQAFYDQGLAYLHSYVWIEAARSFNQALRLDPALALAHVGLSYAFVELNNPDEASAALDRARTLAPKVSAHDRRHMHGHDLRRAGRVADAIAEFESADRLHREYFTREAVPAQYDWHFHHNLDLLASSRQYLGQMKQAGALLKQSFDLPSNLVLQVYNKREWPSFLRGRGRLDEALAAARHLIAHPHPS